MAGDVFYSSREWVALRKQVTKMWKARGLPCAYCNQPLNWGERPGGPVIDHILNRKQHPHLALVPSNLQAVHSLCNSMKFHAVETGKVAVGLDGFPTTGPWSSSN